MEKFKEKEKFILKMEIWLNQNLKHSQIFNGKIFQPNDLDLNAPNDGNKEYYKEWIIY